MEQIAHDHSGTIQFPGGTIDVVAGDLGLGYMLLLDGEESGHASLTQEEMDAQRESFERHHAVAAPGAETFGSWLNERLDW